MLLRVLIILVAVYAAWRIVAGLLRGDGGGASSRGARFPCSTCAHCGTEFNDGVICLFAGRETFKNEVHIANCGSWTRRRKNVG
jgi:hypothetical protein